MGSYNLFDFSRREHMIKERTAAQVSMAETALELTKAKVAAASGAAVPPGFVAAHLGEFTTM
jgi:hypothetical protein